MENATIQNNAFIFCRYSIAALIWVSLVLYGMSIWGHDPSLVAPAFYVLAAVFVVLDLSALLRVRRAPMVLLWTYTLGRVIPSKDVVLDVKAMRFAHSLGAVIALICLAFMLVRSPLAWSFLFLFAVLKTISALGYCPASKLYSCMVGGSCCAFAVKRDDPRHA